MAHELFCLSFVKFEIGTNRLRIKFCVGVLNLVLSNIWAWYPKKQPNLKKWFKIEKKKTTFVLYSCKIDKCWDQTFLTGTCPGIVRLQQSRSFFYSDPLTFDHAHIFPRKSSGSAKSNPIFHLKRRKDTALILRFLDSWMSEFLYQKYLFFSISVSFMG